MQDLHNMMLNERSWTRIISTMLKVKVVIILRVG